MKKSLSVLAVICVCVMSHVGQAQSATIINGTNPRPTAQIINGTNPRPTINGTNPRPQTTSAPTASGLPGWVQTVLSILNLM